MTPPSCRTFQIVNCVPSFKLLFIQHGSPELKAKVNKLSRFSWPQLPPFSPINCSIPSKDHFTNSPLTYPFRFTKRSATFRFQRYSPIAAACTRRSPVAPLSAIRSIPIPVVQCPPCSLHWTVTITTTAAATVERSRAEAGSLIGA